eukprot:TRINITY_DN4467_c0_g1_i1.p1 TRINITY_DN4467_c0_g1~~TRINITY_DN4467_c0_g1_i1.p1  ORF type:complete len:564 (+),score=136.35 TRINITY_DN4467_c0_g1_i1:56-1747(+)
MKLRRDAAKKHDTFHEICECGDFLAVKKLYTEKHKKLDINKRDKRGRFGIHLAIESKDKKLIEYLLSLPEIDINVEDESTECNVLHYAALTEDALLFHLLLTNEDMQVAGNPNIDRNTPLHYYCAHFNDTLDSFNILLKKGAQVNFQNYSGETPLHNASWGGHDKTVTLLLENGADPNQQNDHGETPLHWAARSGSEKVIKILLKGGADATIQGASGTPYSVAVPYSEKVKYLLRDGKMDLKTTPNKAKDTGNSTILLTDKRKITPFHWEIDYGEIKFIKEIGRGGCGVVYKGEWRGIEVAIKQIIKEKMSPELFERFLQEISIMSKLHHPNILLLCGACIQPKICYITEYMSQGSLRDVLSKKKKLEWRMKLNIALETARAMKYLHGLDPPVLHHDLKSLNILLDENSHVKVADFGLSTLKEPDGENVVGLSLNWAAPEVVSGDRYTEKSDIYSFGMVLWELLTHKVPYEGKNSLQLLNAIVEGKLPKFPKGTDLDFQELVNDCWDREPKGRPDFTDIYNRLKKMKKSKPESDGSNSNNNNNIPNSTSTNQLPQPNSPENDV